MSKCLDVGVQFILPLLDPQRVQLHAFSNSTIEDAVSEQLRAACQHWHVVVHHSDDALAQLIHQSDLDILLDLSGLTAGNRLEVLAYKPAPVIVNWLGYFGTVALPTVDYLLADPWCLPPHEEALVHERVWRLPASRFCMAPPVDAPEPNALPALHTPCVTLASFQELAKINDRVLICWAQILKSLPHARLRLQSRKLADPVEKQWFVQRLERQGIDMGRVELLGAQDRNTYLAAHHEVDFILDTFPYPGGTTTCEALWMGVPTLTLATPGLLGRQGQAHLMNVGLPDWVCESEQAYVQNAVHHASDLTTLAELRAQLRQRCAQSALFDNRRFAQDWMQAVEGMALLQSPRAPALGA